MAHEGVTDDRLRELYERALAERGARDRARCPAPEAILALVRRDGPEERRLATLDHVMACDACRGEFELLRAIERAGEQTGGARAAAPGSWARRGWRGIAPLALAASVLVAVGLGVWQRIEAGGGPDVERGASDDVTLLAPPADVAPGAPITFVWRPVPGARRYELEVLDAAGTVVYAAATSDTTATIGDAARLRPAVDYRWWVRATSEGGARASAMRRLRVRAP